MGKEEILIHDIFIAEDFPHGTLWNNPNEMAKHCNAHFKEWANEQTKIYTNTNVKNAPWGYEKTSLDMHVALLAFPQAIKKECAHEIIEYTASGFQPATQGKCVKCGAKLIAKWETA